MKMKLAPLRLVNKRIEYSTRYNRYGEGGYQDILECGHEWYGKRSQGEPRRRRCRDCFHNLTNMTCPQRVDRKPNAFMRKQKNTAPASSTVQGRGGVKEFYE